MIVFFGQRLYGKVDHVPGLFYVATQFFYLQFVPLIPTGTYLVLDGSEDGGNFRGKQITLSGKSVLFGWLRAGCIMGGIGLLVAALITFLEMGKKGELSHAPFVLGFLGAGALALFWASYYLGRPSLHRALRHAADLGL